VCPLVRGTGGLAGPGTGREPAPSASVRVSKGGEVEPTVTSSAPPQQLSQALDGPGAKQHSRGLEETSFARVRAASEHVREVFTLAGSPHLARETPGETANLMPVELRSRNLPWQRRLREKSLGNGGKKCRVNRRVCTFCSAEQYSPNLTAGL